MTNTIEIRNYIDKTLLKHNVLTESKGFPMEENHINRLGLYYNTSIVLKVFKPI